MANIRTRFTPPVSQPFLVLPHLARFLAVRPPLHFLCLTLDTDIEGIGG
jgi:hypothetical protein